MSYGIIIRMYLLDNKHHNLPHIHAKYAEFEASICIVKTVKYWPGNCPVSSRVGWATALSLPNISMVRIVTQTSLPNVINRFQHGNVEHEKMCPARLSSYAFSL
jgi:hypothetical protein